MRFIAVSCHIGIRLRPRLPAGTLARDVFKTDAVNRANRNAQLAAGAVFLDHRVHHFVAAKDGIGRTNRKAQRAAYAPFLSNDGDRAWAFCAVHRVHGQHWPPGDGCQSLNASSASWWALVDVCNV